MSDERPKGFLSRVFGPVEDDHTSVYSDNYGDPDTEDGGVPEAEDEPIEETGRSFTVERAAEIIKHLPPEVPRSSAVRIVRQTLVAAGIDMDDLTRSTVSREEKLNLEISQRETKIEDLRQRTDETVRDLERRIREAQEDRDTGVAAEERRISSAREGLEDVQHVRDFFDLPAEAEAPLADDYNENSYGESSCSEGSYDEDPHEDAYDAPADDTRVLDRSEIEDDNDDTRIIRRPEDTGRDNWDTRSERGL